MWHLKLIGILYILTASRIPTAFENGSISTTVTAKTAIGQNSNEKNTKGKQPLSRKVSFDDQVQIIKDQYSERHRSTEENTSGRMDSRREASKEEIEVDRIIQQKILGRRQVDEGGVSEMDCVFSVVGDTKLMYFPFVDRHCHLKQQSMPFVIYIQ